MERTMQDSIYLIDCFLLYSTEGISDAQSMQKYSISKLGAVHLILSRICQNSGCHNTYTRVFSLSPHMWNVLRRAQLY